MLETVVDCPEYLFELERVKDGEGREMVFAHIRVRKWSKSTLKQILHDYKLLRQYITCPLFATAEVDDEKWASFISYFGFRYLMDTVCESGEPRRLFVSFAENNENNNGNVVHRRETHRPAEQRQRDHGTVETAAALPDGGA